MIRKPLRSITLYSSIRNCLCQPVIIDHSANVQMLGIDDLVSSANAMLCFYRKSFLVLAMHSWIFATLIRCLHYFCVILVFGLGAGIGSYLSSSLHRSMIWICSIFLCVAFVLMLKPADY
ncbi:MAG: DUF1275 domain-containing protein [Galactobacillus timonensis]|uniref:hypothetical protein n=1 Tax=Galactobacillus timonensis TaxID=2041840 RepID=UPI0023F1A2A7|nr:hypothetical protein [Galactobacillus timonensis]MCI6066714.1 DUF1275 domain-containing protein [Galactobacillus timonensis]